MIWDGPSIVEVARASGREPKRVGSRLRVRCPNPVHPDENPSCDLTPEIDAFICWGCGAKGGVVKFATLAGVTLKNLSCSPPPTVRAVPRPITTSKRKPFPVPEAKDLWRRSGTVLDDSEVYSYLKDVRHVDPGDVDLHGLARAISLGSAPPWWARFDGVSWTESGHRLLLPMYDSAGNLAGVRGRRVFSSEDGLPKSLTPIGLSLKGLVLANNLARLLLAGGTLGDGSPVADLVRRAEVLVCEGDIDFLQWSSDRSDSDELAPAVFGVGRGWWTAEIASRIPSGTTVTIRAHDDDAGWAYARDIGHSLHPRCPVLVLRTQA